MANSFCFANKRFNEQENSCARFLGKFVCRLLKNNNEKRLNSVCFEPTSFLFRYRFIAKGVEHVEIVQRRRKHFLFIFCKTIKLISLRFSDHSCIVLLYSNIGIFCGSLAFKKRVTRIHSNMGECHKCDKKHRVHLKKKMLLKCLQIVKSH